MHYNLLFLSFLSIVFTASCQTTPSETSTTNSQDNVAPIDTNFTDTVVENTPVRLEDTLFQSQPDFIAEGFDFPVGIPDGKNYYIAQDFDEVNNSFGGNIHLGEDWNGTGGGNTDLGDPVYTIADGYVNYSTNEGPGWGNVVKITHKVCSTDTTFFVESLYGHLDTIMVPQGTYVKKGQQIGTIGNADGAYWAHLHLELRIGALNGVGGGYESTPPSFFLDPSDFIKTHRKIAQ